MESDEKKTMRPSELFRPVMRFWWMIMIVFIGVVGTVGFLTFQAQEIFEAKGTVYIRQYGGLDGDIFQQSTNQKYLVKNQIPILKSRSLAGDVIQRMQNSPFKDSLCVLGHCPEKKPIPILGKYIPRRKQDRTKTQPSLQQMVESFREATKVIESAETNIIELRAQATTNWEAAYFINVWIDAYLDFDIMNSQGDVGQTRDFLERKIREVRSSLDQSETALASYQKMNKVVSLPEETQELVAQLSRFEALYDQTRTDQEALKQQLTFLKAQLDTSRKNLVENMTKLSNPILQELQGQMARQVGEKAAYEAQLIGAGLDTQKDNKLLQMENRITGLQDRIIEETKRIAQNNLSGINPLTYSENLINQILVFETKQKSVDASAAALKKIVDDYSRKLNSLPDKNLQLARLERDVKLNRETYMTLAQKFEEIRIREASEMANIRVIDRGEPPAEPIYPRKKLNFILAGFFGLLLGFGLAFTRDYFDQTVRSAHDLHEMNIHVIGNVPSVRVKSPRFGKSVKGQDYDRARSILPYLLNYQKVDPAIEEGYRSIRTNIHHLLKEKQGHIVLITSAGPGEGKSTTSVNLAIAMARKGIKTLLMDCDLRQPLLDTLLTGSQRKLGLTYHLKQKEDWQTSVIPTTQEDLDLMPSGPPVKNAPELLGSRSMNQLLRDLKKQYGVIILDTPPILPVTDTTVLTAWADGVLLVVKTNDTGKLAVKHAVDQLHGVKAHFWGTILIGVAKKKLYTTGEYY